MLNTYLIIYGASLLIAIGVNYFLLKKYAEWGVKDHEEEGQERWVSITKPAVGGIGFFIMFVIAFAYVILTKSFTSFNLPVIGFIFATIIGFTTGLIDDRKAMPPWFKFAGQILCGLVLYFSGIFIEMNTIPACNLFITLFWVVGIMNSVNMLDNMDGITASTAYFIILSCMIAHFTEGLYTDFHGILLGIAIIVLGGVSGFLKYNWAPAKMYMGDSGSQFLGAFLAGISMVYLWNFKDYEYAENFIQWRQFAIPLIAFVVPIIDTSTVFIRRIARGQSPFVGGRDHTTHQLAIAGLKDGKVGLVFMMINLFSAMLIYWLIPKTNNWNTAYTLGAFFYFTILFTGFQLVYWWNKK